MKVLIVDDSPMIRGAINSYLDSVQSEDSFQVVGQAGDGMEALDMFREHSPDIVTMDITMPEMDGLSCLEEMLKIDNGTKAIVITALGDKATGLRAIEIGASAFVLKPFTKEDFVGAIQRITGGA